MPSKRNCRRRSKGKKVFLKTKRSKYLEGLEELLRQLQTWGEVATIHPGTIKAKKKLVTASTDKFRKPSNGGGGLKFRATRWAVNNSGVVTGIKCNASDGSSTQTVVLTSANYPDLLIRLYQEGYGSKWLSQELARLA